MMKNKLLDRVLDNLAACQIAKGDKLLLAVSGGVDSVVLAHLIADIAAAEGYYYGIVHLNHMLRGEESRADYALVEALANELSCDFYGFERNVSDWAKKEKLSFELAARKIRYQLFDEVLVDKAYDYLLTAHHLGDNAETILFNLFRGTALAGLSGIPMKNGRIIRPLIDIDKDDLYNLAEAMNWKYREDATNNDMHYARNRIRNSIIPEVEQYYNPRIKKQLFKMAKIIKAEDGYLSHLAHEALLSLSAFKKNELRIDLKQWKNMDIVLRRRMVREIFTLFLASTDNLSFDQVEILDQWFFKGKIASRQQVLGLLFYMNGDFVTIKPVKSTKIFRQEIKLTMGKNEILDENLVIIFSEHPLDSTTLYLPKKLFQQGVYLRYPQAKDYIRPLGMKGHRKQLSKVLSEAKIEISERKNIPILAIKDEVIWVKGIRKSVYERKNMNIPESIYVSIKDLSN